MPADRPRARRPAPRRAATPRSPAPSPRSSSTSRAGCTSWRACDASPTCRSIASMPAALVQRAPLPGAAPVRRRSHGDARPALSPTWATRRSVPRSTAPTAGPRPADRGDRGAHQPRPEHARERPPGCRAAGRRLRQPRGAGRGGSAPDAGPRRHVRRRPHVRRAGPGAHRSRRRASAAGRSRGARPVRVPDRRRRVRGPRPRPRGAPRRAGRSASDRLAVQHGAAAEWYEASRHVPGGARPLPRSRATSATRCGSSPPSTRRLYDTGLEAKTISTIQRISPEVIVGDLEALLEYAWCHLLVDRRRFTELVDHAGWVARRVRVDRRPPTSARTCSGRSR